MQQVIGPHMIRIEQVKNKQIQNPDNILTK